jgi:heme/copper-type cytochrome/quinol oxidase subunit 1
MDNNKSFFFFIFSHSFLSFYIFFYYYCTMDERTAAVRTNWLRFSWNQISRANKVLLVIATLLSLVQIIVSAVMLGLGSQRHLSCDKPLQMYLIIFAVRVGISLPFTIYQHLTTPRRRRQQRTRRQRQRRSNRRETRTDTNSVTAAPTMVANNEHTTSEHTHNEHTTDEHHHEANTHNNTTTPEAEQQPATLVTGWANRLDIKKQYVILCVRVCDSKMPLY